MDVRLVGTVYTRTLARRYLSPSLVNKWYPFHCFQLICELLYGRVPCYATYTKDVVDDGSKVRAKDEDLILSKVSFLLFLCGHSRAYISQNNAFFFCHSRFNDSFISRNSIHLMSDPEGNS